MSKKKIDDPLFLDFVNLEDLPPDKTHVKGRLKQLLKKGNFPPDQTNILKRAINDFDNFNDEYIQTIISAWRNLNSFLLNFIYTPPEWGKYHRLASVFGTDAPLFPNVEPVLYRKDSGGYKVKLEPTQEISDNFSTTHDLVGTICADLANFLLKHEREGIFAYCNLGSCDHIIITTNGRKSCCDSHRVKACNENKKNDLDHAKYKRIRNRLSKQYYRYGGLKSSLNEFTIKNWPSDSRIGGSLSLPQWAQSR